MVEAGQKQWYIVHTYSGFEERVKENLTQRVDALGMREKFGEIKIPTETRSEMRKVSFPGRDEVFGTTIVVVITSAIFAVFLFLSDQLIVLGYQGLVNLMKVSG